MGRAEEKKTQKQKKTPVVCW